MPDIDASHFFLVFFIPHLLSSQHDAQLDYYGKRLATASSDRTIKIYEVTDNQQTLSATLQGHEGPVWQVAWAHPKFGTVLASCGYDNRIIVWKEQSAGVWTKLWDDDRHEASVNSLCWAPHALGLILAAASSDGYVSVWAHRPDNTWERDLIPAHKGGVSAVSWGPELRPGVLLAHNSASELGHATTVRRLVTGGCDNFIRVWQYDASQLNQGNAPWVEVRQFESPPAHADWVRDVAWAPSVGLASSTIASAGEDKTVSIWTEDARGVWRKAKDLKFDSKVWRVSWSLIGNVLAVSQGDNKVSLWKESPDGSWGQISLLDKSQAEAAALDDQKLAPSSSSSSSAPSSAVPLQQHTGGYGSQPGYGASGPASSAPTTTTTASSSSSYGPSQGYVTPAQPAYGATPSASTGYPQQQHHQQQHHQPPAPAQGYGYPNANPAYGGAAPSANPAAYGSQQQQHMQQVQQQQQQQQQMQQGYGYGAQAHGQNAYYGAR